MWTVLHSSITFQALQRRAHEKEKYNFIRFKISAFKELHRENKMRLHKLGDLRKNN